MKLNPLLQDPCAVLVLRTPVEAPVPHAAFSQAARRAVEALDLRLEGERLTIKPNVTSGERFADPDTGITTHPAFVGGLIEALRERGARAGSVYIVEDPRNSNDDAPRHWQGTGYVEMADATGAQLRSPSRFHSARRAVPEPLVHGTRTVSRFAVGPDTVLINVPKLKTHNLGITTLCLKNLMGLDNVYDRHYCAQAMRELPAAAEHAGQPRPEWMDAATHEAWQEGLARRLADLARAVTPQLNIVEGIVGRDGTGFQNGTNYALGLVVAGVNMVAVDAVASYLMGFDPERLIYLRVAEEAGLGTRDLARLRVVSVEGGGLAPCRTLDAYRADPPFRVIRNIVGDVP